MYNHYVVTTTGSAQKLSAQIGTEKSRLVTGLSIQPGASNAGAAYLGDKDLSDTSYAIRLPAAADGEPPAPFQMEGFRGGSVGLEQIYVLGANGEKLHVGVVWI